MCTELSYVSTALLCGGSGSAVVLVLLSPFWLSQWSLLSSSSVWLVQALAVFCIGVACAAAAAGVVIVVVAAAAVALLPLLPLLPLLLLLLHVEK